MIYELIGWTGTILFIVSYTLLSLKKIPAASLSFQAMNALGGLCLVINALHLQDNPTLVVNLLWMCMSIYAMLTQPRKKVDA